MINNISYIKFNQTLNEFYMLSLEINDLLDNYQIDLYDENNNPDGYQRPIQKGHRKKIMEYLINEKNPILNTAILAATDYIEEEGGLISIKHKLKIVDGQHRIEAFKELREINPSFFKEKFINFQVPVILMKTNENKIIEMETFVSINNKNKRVNTALAERILEKIREEKKPEYYSIINWVNMEQNDRKDFINSIGNRVTIALNEDNDSVWFKLIKTGDSNTKDRVISLNTFNNSLKPLIQNYLEKNFEDEIIPNKLVNTIYNMVTDVWDTIRIKWGKAFNIKYYNLQKGIGVYTIHNIFSQCINNSAENYFENFNRIIEESTVQTEDWLIGGKFSPLNSKSGMKEIEKYILNQISD